MIGQFLVNGLITGMIYSMVSLGFALVYNTTRIFHIAYAGLYMAGPYFLILFLKTLGVPLAISLICAILLTILLGLIIEWSVYGPLSRKRSSANVIMVSSIGVMIVIINIIAMAFGNETQIINPEISKSIMIGQILITKTQLFQFIIPVALLSAFFMFLKFSQFGIQTRAFRDDQQLCAVLGLDTHKLRQWLFILSSFFAGVGGCLVAYDVGMDPYVGMPMLLNAIVALIIGGVGRFEAPVLGGVIIGLLQALVVYAFSSRWQDVVTFLLLILFMLFRPQGILGEKLRSV